MEIRAALVRACIVVGVTDLSAQFTSQAQIR